MAEASEEYMWEKRSQFTPWLFPRVVREQKREQHRARHPHTSQKEHHIDNPPPIVPETEKKEFFDHAAEFCEKYPMSRLMKAKWFPPVPSLYENVEKIQQYLIRKPKTYTEKQLEKRRAKLLASKERVKSYEYTSFLAQTHQQCRLLFNAMNVLKVKRMPGHHRDAEKMYPAEEEDPGLCMNENYRMRERRKTCGYKRQQTIGFRMKELNLRSWNDIYEEDHNRKYNYIPGRHHHHHGDKHIYTFPDHEPTKKALLCNGHEVRQCPEEVLANLIPPKDIVDPTIDKPPQRITIKKSALDLSRQKVVDPVTGEVIKVRYIRSKSAGSKRSPTVVPASPAVAQKPDNYARYSGNFKERKEQRNEQCVAAASLDSVGVHAELIKHSDRRGTHATSSDSVDAVRSQYRTFDSLTCDNMDTVPMVTMRRIKGLQNVRLKRTAAKRDFMLLGDKIKDKEVVMSNAPVAHIPRRCDYKGHYLISRKKKQQLEYEYANEKSFQETKQQIITGL